MTIYKAASYRDEKTGKWIPSGFTVHKEGVVSVEIENVFKRFHTTTKGEADKIFSREVKKIKDPQS